MLEAGASCGRALGARSAFAFPRNCTVNPRWFGTFHSSSNNYSLKTVTLIMSPAPRCSADDLKALAEEVMGLVRDSVGVSDFVSAYNVVRQDVKVSRDDRKRKAAIAALVDPERVAKKKIATGQKRQAQKKRKIEEHRRSDGRARR